MELNKRFGQVPSTPGIYIMKGDKKRVIYVGKAKNLRNRLRSYFHSSASLDARKSSMVKEIKDFDYIITENELEALVLEANYIKRFRPKFNVILRDDKNYPYLKLTLNEDWPRLEVVRRIKDDGSLYFGPYVPSGTMREILRFIRRNFQLRTCRCNLQKPFRPCVQYQMKRCLAPCSKDLRGDADREKYSENVKEVKLFLQGEQKGLLSSLEERMKNLSDCLEFEEAAEIRDRLKKIQRAWESQRVIAPELRDADVIGIYREDKEASLFLLFIRNGQVIGQKDFFLTKVSDIDDKDIVSGFIEQFYSGEILIPPKIITPVMAALKIEKEWLRNKRGHAVRLSYAGNEGEKKVLKMANENAIFAFNRHKGKNIDKTLLALKELLRLKNIPGRIEAVDISNISGAEAVGAFVVWEDGKFVKDDYRLYKIRTVSGIDDFAMMQEVIGRHLKNISEGKNEMPKLILIDGGRGQMRSAMNALKLYALPVEIAAIAKAKRIKRRADAPLADREEIPDRIFLPGKRSSIALEPLLPSTHLLQKIRDEVHRFAIKYHKKLRSNRVIESPLEKIRGIGKNRRLLLLKHFGSIDKIREAQLDEIASLKGINMKTAELITKFLKK